MSLEPPQRGYGREAYFWALIASLGVLKALLGPLGCQDAAIPRWSIFDRRIALAGNAHQCGTVRFGTAASARDW
jgi:hypothetical protein